MSTTNSQSHCKLKLGDQVILHFRLDCNGEEIANTFAGQPETLRIGQADIDPRLEALLVGLQVGDKRTFELEAGAAFGNYDASMVHNLPRGDFADDMDLTAGHEVEFTLPNRQTLHGIIRGISEDLVTVDFNHPLAGLPVVLEVEILAIHTDQ